MTGITNRNIAPRLSEDEISALDNKQELLIDGKKRFRVTGKVPVTYTGYRRLAPFIVLADDAEEAQVFTRNFLEESDDNDTLEWTEFAPEWEESENHWRDAHEMEFEEVSAKEAKDITADIDDGYTVVVAGVEVGMSSERYRTIREFLDDDTGRIEAPTPCYTGAVPQEKKAPR